MFIALVTWIVDGKQLHSMTFPVKYKDLAPFSTAHASEHVEM
jgi:hypothetical protein